MNKVVKGNHPVRCHGARRGATPPSLQYETHTQVCGKCERHKVEGQQLDCAGASLLIDLSCTKSYPVTAFGRFTLGEFCLFLGQKWKVEKKRVQTLICDGVPQCLVTHMLHSEINPSTKTFCLVLINMLTPQHDG